MRRRCPADSSRPARRTSRGEWRTSSGAGHAVAAPRLRDHRRRGAAGARVRPSASEGRVGGGGPVVGDGQDAVSRASRACGSSATATRRSSIGRSGGGMSIRHRVGSWSAVCIVPGTSGRCPPAEHVQLLRRECVGRLCAPAAWVLAGGAQLAGGAAGRRFRIPCGQPFVRAAELPVRPGDGPRSGAARRRRAGRGRGACDGAGRGAGELRRRARVATAGHGQAVCQPEPHEAVTEVDLPSLETAWGPHACSPIERRAPRRTAGSVGGRV